MANKSILIIDTPKSCMECKLKYLDTGDDAYFGTSTYRCIWDGSEILRTGIDEYCPLKQLPQKKSIELACQKDDAGNEYGAGLIVGWNDCLDEILGE